MILTAIRSASDGKDENCQSSYMTEYWLQLTSKEKLRIPIRENILYSGLLCVFHPDCDFSHNFNGPSNSSGSQPTCVCTSLHGAFSARTKRENSYSKPAYICLRSVSELNTLGEAQLVTLPFRNDIADVEAYRNKFKRCNYYVRSILGDTLHWSA